MITPLTKAEWKGMSGKAQWDVISALRGPDLSNSGTIKWFTTSVIRGKLREVMRVGGQVNEDLNLIILPGTFSSPIVAGLFDAEHFLTHISTAASWLSIPVRRVPPQDFWAPYRSYELAARRFDEVIGSQTLVDHIHFLATRGY